MEDKSEELQMPPMKIPPDLPSNAKVPLKIDTLLWLISSAVILYYSDIINVINTDSRINGVFFTLAVWLTALSLGVALFLIIWCSYIKGIDTDDWESHFPFAIPIATGSGVVSGICWNVALWSVYGVKTPVITLVLLMGFVMLVSIIPTWSSTERKSRKQPLDNSAWLKAHGKVD